MWPNETRHWVSVAWPLCLAAGLVLEDVLHSTANFSLFPVRILEKKGLPAKKLGKPFHSHLVHCLKKRRDLNTLGRGRRDQTLSADNARTSL